MAVWSIEVLLRRWHITATAYTGRTKGHDSAALPDAGGAKRRMYGHAGDAQACGLVYGRLSG